MEGCNNHGHSVRFGECFTFKNILNASSLCVNSLSPALDFRAVQFWLGVGEGVFFG